MATNRSIFAIFGLMTGATVWGVVWYPFRLLNEMGVHGIAATAGVYMLALVMGAFLYHKSWRKLDARAWPLVWVALAAGWTNLAYVVAVIHGEVVRVILLFYLAPLWTIFLSRFFLGERLTRPMFLVMTLAVSGALTMLWRSELGSPWPKNVAEWIAISAGFAFALTNVLTRRATQAPLEWKSLAVWGGVILVSAGWSMFETAHWEQLANLSLTGLLWLVLIAVAIFIATIAMQYGLTHTPANRAIVILLFELVVVAITSYYWANETHSLREWIGGAMIVAASTLSSLMEKDTA